MPSFQVLLRDQEIEEISATRYEIREHELYFFDENCDVIAVFAAGQWIRVIKEKEKPIRTGTYEYDLNKDPFRRVFVPD